MFLARVGRAAGRVSRATHRVGSAIGGVGRVTCKRSRVEEVVEEGVVKKAKGGFEKGGEIDAYPHWESKEGHRMFSARVGMATGRVRWATNRGGRARVIWAKGLWENGQGSSLNEQGHIKSE